jgi:hypothetical protein
MNLIAKCAAIGTALVLSGCWEASGPADYLKIIGGGLNFNYRYSQAFMIVVGKQVTPLPEGSTLEAAFQVPGPDTPQIVRMPRHEGKLVYKLQTEPVLGIVKGGKYQVTLRLLDKDGKEIDRDETVYTSDVDQSNLPTKPLVDGPAYSPQLENL